ncbi:Os03g0577800, partial [Oryza sativa Japonica Group]
KKLWDPHVILFHSSSLLSLTLCLTLSRVGGGGWWAAALGPYELPHHLLRRLQQSNADSEVAAMAATKTVDDESVESYVTQMMHGPLVFE